MRPFESLILCLLFPAFATAFQLVCFSEPGCKGAKGSVHQNPTSICANVVGRRSCKVWDNQITTNGVKLPAGPIRFQGCRDGCGKACSSCNTQIVGMGGQTACFDFQNHRHAVFTAAPMGDDTNLLCLSKRGD